MASITNRRSDPARHASYSEAVRGIYIDFEGFKDTSPALLGLLREGSDEQFEQIVFDDELEAAAVAKGLRTGRLDAEIERLIAGAKSEERMIFAFTRHEQHVVNSYTSHGDDFRPLHKDAHKIASRWYNRYHRGEELRDKSLRGFQEFMGNPRPTFMGLQQATKRLRDVRNMLKAKGSYEALTPVAKGKWGKLLAHNRMDCTCLRQLMLMATKEMGHP